MTKVSINRLSRLSVVSRIWKLDLTADVWNGKPPFRYIDIGRSVASAKYF